MIQSKRLMIYPRYVDHNSRGNEQIPTLYDCVKYDIIHNPALINLGFKQLYHDSKLLADIIVPQVWFWSFD